MTKGILGRKVGMTQIYNEAGMCIPVTVVQAGPCHVLQVRTKEHDGYDAVQLGFLDKPRRLASRSERGQVAKLDSKRSKKLSTAGTQVADKANCEPQRFMRELRGPLVWKVQKTTPPAEEGAEPTIAVEDFAIAVGGQVTVAVMEGVRAVDVTAMTKGRGFTGAMKRHNFAGQRATHGVKKVHRHMGGTGALAANRGGGRMKKGKCMPGQYGHERVTIRNIKLVKIDPENNLLLINGCVPGPNGGYVMVRATNKVGQAAPQATKPKGKK